MFIQAVNFNNQPSFMSSNSNSIPKKALETLLKEGISVKEIAKLYNTNNYKIYNLINKFNLQKPNEIRRSGDNPIMKKLDKLLPELIDKGKSISEISNLISVSRENITKWLKQNFPQGFREFKKERNLTLLRSSLTDQEIADKKGIKRSSVRRVRSKLGISPDDNGKIQKAKEIAQQCKTVAEMSERLGWDYNFTRKYAVKYQLLEILENNKKNFIINCANQGLGKYETAKRLNITHMTLDKLLKKYGLESVFEDYKSNLIKAVLKLHNKGLSMKEIGQNLGIPPRTVSHYLKKGRSLDKTLA